MFRIGRHNDRPPILLKYRSSTWYIVSAVSIAVFTDIFLYAVIVPVVPFALSERAGIDESRIQYWVTVLLAVYGAALLAASPVCGWVADRSSSRRAPLLSGLVVLAGATVMLCVGNTIGIFIAGRVLQGLSAAVVWTVGLALLVDTVGQEHIGEAMGYVGMGMSLAVLAAPLLGGVVFDRAGYYPVFAMCFALIAVDIFLRLTLIEKKVAAKWLPPAANAADAHIAHHLTDPPPEGDVEKSNPSSADATPPRSTSTPSIRLLDPSDPFNTTRTPSRLNLPPTITLLSSPRLLAALWGCLIQASLLTAFDSVLPLRVASIFHWNSLGAGLIFLPFVLPSFIAPVIGASCDKYGARWLASAGFVLATPFLACLRFVRSDSLGQKALLCVLLAGIGFAVNLTLMPLLAEIAYVVEAREKARPGSFGRNGAYAQAYGLFNTAYAAGCLVGPIWAGLLQERRGWGYVTWTLALLSGVSVVPTVLFVGGWVGERGNRERRIAKVGKDKGEEAGVGDVDVDADADADVPVVETKE